MASPQTLEILVIHFFAKHSFYSQLIVEFAIWTKYISLLAYLLLFEFKSRTV